MRRMLASLVITACLLVASGSAAASAPQPPTPPPPTQPPPQPPAPGQPPPVPPPPEEEMPAESPVYAEQVVVTASRVEQQLVNAPATVSIVTTDAIESTPATNYAELLRSVPGVNIAQTSARDFNITLRGATSTLSTAQLALIDGRSLYLDFFGFVAWDLLPINPNEIRQIEVIRGPASAVWGANAMNGVVNFISRTPRELNGNSATISLGALERDVNDSGQSVGTMFSINGTHARAVNDRWAYKLSAGGYTSDAFARPTGVIPGTQTPYPAFVNQGTTQPKFDARADYDAADGSYKLVFGGGYAGTEGIIHTGIGPFDMNRGVGLGYATMRYTRQALRFNVFTNILNGDATGLLSFGANGLPIPFDFNTKTYDVEVGNVNTVGTRQVISYGGNFRYNRFALSIAPLSDNRIEVGGYVQDEIFLNNAVRLNLGARIDKFDVIDDPVFSPRVALILKPIADHAIRLSYNKAFRSPSLVNNFLDVTIVNQLNFAQLASISPVFAQFGTFNFPVRAVGNRDLKEESIEAFEVGYTGLINDRATVSAAVYFNKNTNEIFFTQVGRYRATSPPPGWLQRLAPLGPQLALGVLEGLPPACPSLAAACNTGGLPSDFSYRNLGVNRNKGFELGIDGAVSRALNVYANYSFQATPDPEFDLSEVNIPPRHRVNTGFNFSHERYLGNMSVSYVDEAFFQDVLDSRFHGPTEAYTQVNAAFGVRWLNDRLTTSLKVINIGNADVQSHVFGDIIKRQTIGELRFTF